ncbi:MAG: SurA N-terminal domain-containing protein [Gammaproteobacteria bacterium]|nr:SurA N-terminal domain-containing protein [Gammaproteobacteria bacterium]
MLQTMRAKAQGVGAKIIVWSIIIALSAFGFGFGTTALFQSGDRFAAEVNGEDISLAELERELQVRRSQMRDQFGGDYVNQLDDSILLQSTLAQLIRREIIAQGVLDFGLAAAESKIDEMIVADPSFALGDAFSADVFRSRLTSAGFTPDSYRDAVSEDLSVSLFQQALLDSAFLTPRDSRNLADLALQRRDLAWLEFEPSAYFDSIEITEDELATAYSLRQAEFMTEPLIDAEIIGFQLEYLAGDDEFAPDEALLQAAYEAELADYQSTEQRDASHILLEVSEARSEADAITEILELKARVDAGESFAELAREFSDDPGSASLGGSLGPAARGVYVDAFDTALWALDIGDYSEPVVTEFGVHLIRLDDASETSPPTFEERRAALESELRRAAASDRFAEIKLEADDLAFDAQTSLAPLAEAFDADIESVTGISRSQGDGAFGDETIREALFSPDVMDSGFNSPVIEVGEDAAYVVRASAVYPATEIPFDDVRDDIRADIEFDRGSQMAAEVAENALARMLEGASAAEIAADASGDASDGAGWQRRDGLRRDDQDISQALASAAFELPRPAPGERAMGVIALGNGGSALLVVSGVHDGNTAEVPESELTGLEDQIRSLASQRDLAAVYFAMEQSARVESDLLEES